MYKKNLSKSYDVTPKGGNPRETEAWAFMQAARRMHHASEDDDQEALREAIRLNWKLWTMIQSSILDQNSPLPMDLRQSISALADYVDQTTVSLLLEIDPEFVTSLIDINRHMASGLRAKPGEPQNSASDKTPPPPPPPTGLGEDV